MPAWLPWCPSRCCLKQFYWHKHPTELSSTCALKYILLGSYYQNYKPQGGSNSWFSYLIDIWALTLLTIKLYTLLPSFEPVNEIQKGALQIKATEQCFPVILIIVLQKRQFQLFSLWPVKFSSVSIRSTCTFHLFPSSCGKRFLRVRKILKKMTKFYSTTTQVKPTLFRGPLLFNFFFVGADPAFKALKVKQRAYSWTQLTQQDLLNPPYLTETKAVTSFIKFKVLQQSFHSLPNNQYHTLNEKKSMIKKTTTTIFKNCLYRGTKIAGNPVVFKKGQKQITETT